MVEHVLNIIGLQTTFFIK